jgi:hypothetical protein
MNEWTISIYYPLQTPDGSDGDSNNRPMLKHAYITLIADAKSAGAHTILVACKNTHFKNV